MEVIMDANIKMDVKEVVKEITEKIQKSANVKAVFGEPVEKGDFTVIPVGRVSICTMGGLGGEDKGKEKDEKKSGGMGIGIRSKSIPVGYIEISKNGVQYREVTDNNRIILSGMALGAFAIFSFTRLIKKLFK